MRLVILSCMAAAFMTSGCATKRYPMATMATPVEMGLLNCRELAIELARVDAVDMQIRDTANLDWRSVAAFLNDFGIGNVMSRSDADRAVAQRRAAVTTQQAQQGCTGGGYVAQNDWSPSVQQNPQPQAGYAPTGSQYAPVAVPRTASSPVPTSRRSNW